MAAAFPFKSPGEDYDYTWSLATELARLADPLVSVTCTVITADTDPPLVVQAPTVLEDGYRATTWISGGLAGTTYVLRFHGVTAGTRDYEQDIQLTVQQRR